jgi:hypothetical protein
MSSRGAAEQRFGGLKIDDHVDFGGLLDRQVSGLLTLENPASVDAYQTVCVRDKSLAKLMLAQRL